MNTLRKISALALSVILILSCFVCAGASVSNASILTIYQDGMLFNQNETATIEGKATPGSVITLALKDDTGKLIRSGSAAASADGSFFVSFTAPDGSFNEYTIELYENNIHFRTLSSVVFGELWLASGQSNMQYPLSQTPSGYKNFIESAKLDKWLRVLLVPAYPQYNGSTSLVPSEPQNDITDAMWVNGENPNIYSMSGVAYFFAEKLMEEINMPVGILNSSLGGSSIRSWLSREAIDNTPEVKQYLNANGQYIEKNSWNESECNVYQDMTANYNQKIAPLGNFSISGMIWYQGETDLMTGNTQYDKQFNLMQETFTEVFNYENGLLPIVYTQLASYYYSDDGINLLDWNSYYCTMQKAYSTSRAVTTIYDVPLTYVPEAGLIHPERKEEVGERMAYCAAGLVYGKSDTYTASTVESYTIEDNSIYITFDNTGDGLMCPDTELYGFSICSDNGIYVNAKAEIINNDTIKVYADGITSPASVSYAYCVANQDANLYASDSGAIALPVAPFVTDSSITGHYWFSKPWTDCESDKIWYTEDDSTSGYYDMWTAEKAELSYTEDAAFSGESGLQINSHGKQFSVTPTTSYKKNARITSFRDADTDYSYYGTMSFYVKNNSSEAVKFKNVKLYKNQAVWYSPAVIDTLDCEAEIPADGQWHRITLDLNRIYHLGNECSLSYGNDKLSDINSIEFCFSSSDKNADICLDSISFGAEAESIGIRYDVDISNADSIIEFFTGIFLTIFGKFAALFGL